LEKAFSRHSLADAGFVKAASLRHSESLRPREMPMSTDPMQKFGKESMDMAMKAFGVWTKNTQAIASEVADYSKKSFEDSAAAFQKLVGAKSLEKAMEVQTRYLQSSYEELVAETAKIGELYADLAREAYKPFESALMKMPGVGAK
jgi:phasin family protein